MKKFLICFFSVLCFIFLFSSAKLLNSSFGKNLIYDYSKERELSTITFFFDGGSMNYPVEKAGIEKLILESLQKGSLKYSEENINAMQDEYGLKITHSVTFDYSYISFTSFTRHFGKVIDLAADMLENPLFLENSVNIIKRKAVDNIKSKQNNPDELVWIKLNEWFYRNHQYLSFPEGYEKTLEMITIDDMKNHLTYLIKNNRVVVSIVTGLDLKDNEKMIKEKLSFIKTRKNWKKSSPDYFEAIGKDTLIFAKKENLETKYIACKFAIPSVASKDYIPAKIGLSILSKRVYETLRTKHGLTYSAYTGASDRKANYGVFYVSTNYPDSAISLFRKEIDRFIIEGVTQREIDDLKNIYETSFYMNNEVSSEKSFSDGYNHLIYNDPGYDKKLMKKIEKMKPSDIAIALNMHLKEFQFLILE